MSILNNIIIMNRGDTYEFNLNITDEFGEYALQGADTIYFGIMDPGQPFEQALVRKRFTAENLDPIGNLTIVIEPEDTLDLLPGKYFYAVKLHMDHDELDYNTMLPTGNYINKVITIINKTKFIICD
jgi:hypothetical protein